MAKDDVKELRSYVNNQRYQQAKGQRVAAGLIGGFGGVAPLSSVMGVTAKPGRKLAVAARTGGRQMGEAALGSVPGLGAMVVGAKTHNLGLISAGKIGTTVGSTGGGFHGAFRATKNAQLRGDIKKGAGMYSAFGVNHGEEVSKLSMAPIKSGFKAMRFGKAPKVGRVMGRSYKGGIASGQSKIQSGLKAIGSGMQYSPGTAIAAGGLGTAGAGAAGFGLGRRKD
jgi:hypothetical protein